jgi:hypothetical protein
LDGAAAGSEWPREIRSGHVSDEKIRWFLLATLGDGPRPGSSGSDGPADFGFPVLGIGMVGGII